LVDNDLFSPVDFDKSIPGEDHRWPGPDSVEQVVEAVLKELEKEHGSELIIAEKCHYSSFCTETEKGKLANLEELTVLATLNGLWPGGFNICIYQGTPTYVPHKKELPAFDTAPNPLAAIMTAKELKNKRKWIDEVINEGGEGYNPYAD